MSRGFRRFSGGRHLRLREVLIDVEFVGAARVFDDAHVGPVEAFVRGELFRLRSVHERHLSEGDVARQKGAELEARHRGVIPPIATSNLSALKSAESLGQVVSTYSTFQRGLGHGFKELHVVTDVAPVFLHAKGL